MNLDGVSKKFVHIDDNTFGIKYEDDPSEILDANKQYHLHSDGYSPSKDLKHVARIPPILYYKWLFEEGIDCLNPDHQPAVRRKLNSNEYAYLRTGGGVLGGHSRTGD